MHHFILTSIDLGATEGPWEGPKESWVNSRGVPRDPQWLKSRRGRVEILVRVPGGPGGPRGGLEVLDRIYFARYWSVLEEAPAGSGEVQGVLKGVL